MYLNRRSAVSASVKTTYPNLTCVLQVNSQGRVVWGGMLDQMTVTEYHHVHKNLSGSKLLLVPLQPGLIVLYEEMASLTMGEERRAQLAIVAVTRNWSCLELYLTNRL